ncbi:hypothetical protein [Brevundimonas sp.]|uniref:hypothetical protein n=1 Tax=Brevundimonas sp. TaxID=1871086 RepID=UPI002897DE30|nr:hypothetical protein [Brevundimonas sp.]
MVKFMTGLTAIAAVALLSTPAFAGIAPNGGLTLGGTLDLKQGITINGCPVNTIPVTVTAGVGTTTASPLPYALCSSGLGSNVKLQSQWTISSTGANALLISGIRIKSITGECGQAGDDSVTATYDPTPSTGFPNGKITIPVQTIWGKSSLGFVVRCELKGFVSPSVALTIT